MWQKTCNMHQQEIVRSYQTWSSYRESWSSFQNKYPQMFPPASYFPFITTIGCMTLTYLGHFPEVISPAWRETVAPVDSGTVSLSVVSQDHSLPLVTCTAWRGQLRAKIQVCWEHNRHGQCVSWRKPANYKEGLLWTSTKTKASFFYMYTESEKACWQRWRLEDVA